MAKRARNNWVRTFFDKKSVEKIENKQGMGLREVARRRAEKERATCREAGNCGIEAFCGPATIMSEEQWGLNLLGNDDSEEHGAVIEGMEVGYNCNQCSNSSPAFARVTREIGNLLIDDT
ncbi:hypothetical protein KY385_02170 [Candidatus Parcubacteria bacterium]|nr:hypothetical protein [Candidatus Parcubacteria bacterium]